VRLIERFNCRFIIAVTIIFFIFAVTYNIMFASSLTLSVVVAVVTRMTVFGCYGNLVKCIPNYDCQGF